jgi:hypothetical protein
MPTDDSTPNAAQLAAINVFLQTQLREKGKTKVGAIEAAGWLDAAGLLPHGSRPGVNLRKLLRAGQIHGGRQDPPPPAKNGSWFVTPAPE